MLCIRKLANLGPVQVLFPSVILKSQFLLQYLYGRKRRHFRNIIGDSVPNSFLARKIWSSGGHFFDYVFISLKLTFWSISIPDAVLFWWSYSCPIHFLFISSSFLSLFLVHCLFIPVHFNSFLFISYLFPIHCLFVSFSCSFVFSIAFDLRIPKFPKAMGFLLSISCLKTIYVKPQINWDIHFLFILCPSVSRVFQKNWFIKGVVNKVWGLDG